MIQDTYSTYAGMQYLTPEQREILRTVAYKAPPVEQELELLTEVNRLCAAGGEVSRLFFKLVATGSTSAGDDLTGTLSRFETAAARTLVLIQQLRYLTDLRETDVIGGMLGSVNFFINQKLHNLHFKYEEEP